MSWSSSFRKIELSNSFQTFNLSLQKADHNIQVVFLHFLICQHQQRPHVKMGARLQSPGKANGYDCRRNTQCSRKHGCHVAKLTKIDFPLYNGNISLFICVSKSFNSILSVQEFLSLDLLDIYLFTKPYSFDRHGINSACLMSIWSWSFSMDSSPCSPPPSLSLLSLPSSTTSWRSGLCSTLKLSN